MARRKKSKKRNVYKTRKSVYKTKKRHRRAKPRKDFFESAADSVAGSIIKSVSRKPKAQKKERRREKEKPGSNSFFGDPPTPKERAKKAQEKLDKIKDTWKADELEKKAKQEENYYNRAKVAQEAIERKEHPKKHWWS